MAELATLARPYAVAVFDLAVEANNFDEWSDTLNFLATVVDYPTMVKVIANPQIDKKTLTNIILDICRDHISETGDNFVKILVDNNRLPAIPEIVLQYEQLKAQQQGYLIIEIVSPYPVEPSQLEEIKTVLQKRFGKAVDINITIDKSLLGGWLIRVGDEVIDISLLGRLQQLATELRR